MKKILLIPFTFFIVMHSWAQTVQIGNGAASQINIPIFTNTMYSYSQQIITKDELITSGYNSTLGSITRLRYHFNNQTNFVNSNNWKIYIRHTAKTSFSSGTDWESITNLNLVFDDTITHSTSTGWMDILLQTPFLYDGTSNIIIAIDENTYWYTPAHTYYSSYLNSSNKGIFCKSGGNPAIDIDPTIPPLGTLVTTVPAIQLYFQETCSAPSNFNAVSVKATEAQLKWIPQGTETLWNLRYKSIKDSVWTVVNNINMPNFIITNLFPIETYVVQVQANCVGSTSEWVNSITFTTPLIAGMQYGVDWEIYNNQFINDFALMDTLIPNQIIKLDSVNTPDYSTGMDHFLSRIKGYILPRVSGNYSFYFASDNVAQFWLSPDSSETNAQLKSNVLYAQADWNQNISSQNLVAGKKYFFKILHYDSVYIDKIKLGWKMPNETLIKTIKFPYLTSCGNDIVPGSLAILYDSIVGYPNYTHSLKYRFMPWNTTNKSIVWTSTNTSIATVNSNGLVTLIKQGNCNIIGKLVAETTLTDTINVTVWNDSGPFFVKANASIYNDGKSWEKAIDFQTLLGILNTRQVNQIVNIYLSEGIYKPTTNLDRNKSFILNRVRLLGGYAETSYGTDTTMRDILNYETILSGEIGIPNETIDNSFHVVTAYNTTTIDGVTIRDGRASCSTYGFTAGSYSFKPDDSGGGVYIPTIKSNIFIKNSKIKNNSAWNSGGGLCCTRSSINIIQSSLLTLENCSVSENIIQQTLISTGGIFNIQVNGQGAGISLYTSTLNANNCKFYENIGIAHGKVIYLENAASNIENCSIYDNIGNLEDLWATSGSKFQINNSTVKGSLVSFFLSSVNLKNSTIAGGGYVSGGSNNITLDNSIWTGINLNQIPDTNLVKVKYSILGNSLYGSSKYNVVSTTIPTYTSWLEPLADNGGLIPTMKLKNAPNNPAKSNGNPIYLGTADQRGIIRTDSVSIGAYQYIKATDVAITPKQVTLCQGDSISFNVSVSPAFVSDNSYLATSSNSSIAYVANSKIHAFAPGNVDIFIQTNDGGLRDTCKVVVMAPVGSGTIAGATTVCKDQKSVTYTATGFSNAISYVWALPEGATGSSTASSIAVDFSDIAASGNISVKGQNVCGDGEISGLAITVNQYPTAAGAISGASNVCQGQNAVAYSVAPIADAKTYIWNLPTGATETSATNSILMDYGTSTVSGAISVKGNNSCGDGDVSDLPITVYSIPVTPQINLAGSILQSNATSGNQWYNQNGLIPGATNQDYTVTENGEYFTLVTLMNCSSDTSNMISVLNTGIEITDHKKTIQVYPNPVSNELTIEMEGNKGKINFEVINALGEVLLNGNFIEKTTVWMGNFAPGIYIIKLENGKITEIKKIIKE